MKTIIATKKPAYNEWVAYIRYMYSHVKFQNLKNEYAESRQWQGIQP